MRTVVAVTAAAALAFLLTHPPDVFWTTDGGNRFIQVQQLARTWTLPVEYPAASIDPAFALAPTGGHHFLIRDERLHSFYSPAFPLIVAPLYRLFGAGGLYAIPLLSMLAALLLFAPVARELGVTRAIAPSAALLMIATPLFFYTVSFWEHTLAIALTLAGVLLTLRGRPAIGALLVALGAAFREEGYIALAAIAIALLATRRVRDAIVFSAAAAAILIPLWLTNLAAYGHPLGLHSAVYDAIAGGHPLERLTNFWVYLFAFTRVPWVRTAVAVPAIALLLISPLRGSRLRTILLYASAAASLVAAFVLITSGQPLNDAFSTQSLFGAIPFALLFFAVARELPRFLTVMIAATLILTSLALHQGDVGLIWGPRHFLWLLPFLVIAAAIAIEKLPKNARPAIALLVIASIAIQIHGIRLLRMKLDFSSQLLQTLRSSDAEVILTDVFWLPEEMAALWFEKKMLWVKNDRELAGAIDRLKAIGVRRMDFVAAREFHLVSPAGYAPLLAHTYERRRVGGVRSMVTEVQVLYARLDGVREVER